MSITWHNPIQLELDHKEYKFAAPGYEEFFDVAGVYMICRRHSEKISPLYIGKSLNIGRRIEQHLDSVKMIRAIKNAMNGDKVILVGEFKAKKGQQTDKCIRIIERSLIDHALANGHSLYNEKGIKKPSHSITYQGNLEGRNFTSKEMKVKIK